MHSFVFQSTTPTDAVFKCSVCGYVLGFNQAGIGEPCATQELNGNWIPPANPDQWADQPCTQ